MSSGRYPTDDRTIEFDSLALIMFALAWLAVFAAVAALTAAGARSASPAVFLAAGLVAAGVISGWIVGYPRHAALPCMGLVLLIAIIALPRLFPMDGALLRDVAGAPASRVQIAAGLYVGGLGVAMLGFFVACFVGPFIGAVMRLSRGETGARGAFMLHVGLSGSALALTILSSWLL